jgi:hypothetical protein
VLYCFKYLETHASIKLFDEIENFFKNLRKVDPSSNFNPCSQYFSSDFTTYLGGAPGLKKKFRVFFVEFCKLPAKQRVTVIKAFLTLSKVKSVLENKNVEALSLRISKLPQSIRKPAKALFLHMYPSTLNAFGDLNAHYKELYTEFYESRNLKSCPFCGIEELFPPHIRKQDYDHLLKQEDYVFASVNMRNLVPMGRDCNQVFKLRKDVLFGKKNNRRKFAYPYDTSFSIKVELEGSYLPGHAKWKNGIWKIRLQPNNEFVKTWSDVFSIQIRYRDMILTRYYKDWIDQFVSSLRLDKIKMRNQRQLKSQLNRKAILYLNQPLLDNGIVKGAFFKFLSRYDDKSFLKALLIRINS